MRIKYNGSVNLDTESRLRNSTCFPFVPKQIVTTSLRAKYVVTVAIYQLLPRYLYFLKVSLRNLQSKCTVLTASESMRADPEDEALTPMVTPVITESPTLLPITVEKGVSISNDLT
jgi:hypothetical protein